MTVFQRRPTQTRTARTQENSWDFPGLIDSSGADGYADMAVVIDKATIPIKGVIGVSKRLVYFGHQVGHRHSLVVG